MCGIAGVMALSGTLNPAIRAAARDMTTMLAHRGPDGEGIFADEWTALGHRRLAIIDKTGGSQPMANEDESCWLVFNGEIYNHVQLRRELIARGHVFRSLSDTEVIVHGYEEFGTGVVERLEGMFAFAIYDARSHTLFAARDRIGKKPLFYAVLDNTLHFASEIKAFFASPVWNDETDPSSIEEYLALGYIMAPKTAYRHVRKLEPGHLLVARHGRLEIRKYWDIEDFGNDSRSPAVLEADVESTLASAVRERLESEVPLGAFLSGGIDSGLVVSMMGEALGRGPVTTTVGFGDRGHNELGPARLTASHCSTEHHEHIVDLHLEDVLDRIVGAFDEPFADASAIPTYHVSRIARQHVTVALSGDGGDEAFGGYSFRYVPHALESRARALLPGAAGRAAAAWLGTHWPRSPRVPRYLRLGTILENVSRKPELAYAADLFIAPPAMARKLVGFGALRNPDDSPVHAAVIDPYVRCSSRDPLLRAQYADLKVYLPNDVLVKVDRMSMANALEVRCPLLDRRVVELAFRIPTAAKMPGLKPKQLLKRVAARRLPEQLLRLPKRGFTAPVGQWISASSQEEFRHDLLGPRAHIRGLLDMAEVRRLVDEHDRKQANHTDRLWAIWMLERWAQLRARAAWRSRRKPVAYAEASAR